MVYVIQVSWQLASRIRTELQFHPDPARKLPSYLYDTYHCCEFSVKLLMMDRNCPKHVEFHSKNKFENLVHLVGFIIRNLTRCTFTWKSNSLILSDSVGLLTDLSTSYLSIKNSPSVSFLTLSRSYSKTMEEEVVTILPAPTLLGEESGLYFTSHANLRSILTLRRLMSYIYVAPILDVSRSHTTTQHSR